MYFIIIIIIIIIIDIELVQLDGTTAEIANEGQLKMGYFFLENLRRAFPTVPESDIHWGAGRWRHCVCRNWKWQIKWQTKEKEIIKHWMKFQRFKPTNSTNNNNNNNNNNKNQQWNQNGIVAVWIGNDIRTGCGGSGWVGGFLQVFLLWGWFQVWQG